ncbi:MAG: PRC-barrel domain-containing protein [Nanoarchaeota archaeon]
MADEDRKLNSRQLMGKLIVTKSGKRFGEVGDLTFETRTGELIHVVVRNPTGYCEGLDLEKDKSGNPLIPYTAVVAVGDFIVVAEEEII